MGLELSVYVRVLMVRKSYFVFAACCSWVEERTSQV